MQSIHTTQLIIRTFSILDASFVLKLMNTPSWIEHIGDRNVKTVSSASNYIQDKIIRSYRQHGYGLYHVSLNTTNTPIGICGLVKREGLLIPDLGFAMMPKYQGKGYATEASKAVVDYANKTLRLPKLAGITKPENIASIKVLENVGMQFEQMIQLPQDPTLFSLFTLALHKEDE